MGRQELTLVESEVLTLHLFCIGRWVSGSQFRGRGTEIQHAPCPHWLDSSLSPSHLQQHASGPPDFLPWPLIPHLSDGNLQVTALRCLEQSLVMNIGPFLHLPGSFPGQAQLPLLSHSLLPVALCWSLPLYGSSLQAASPPGP